MAVCLESNRISTGNRRTTGVFSECGPLINKGNSSQRADMLSKVSVERIGRVFRWFYAIGVSPLKWNEKRLLFNQKGSAKNLVYSSGSFLLYFLYCINMNYSMVSRLVESSFKSKADLALNFIWCCCFNATLFTVWTNLRRRRDVADFLNQLLILDARLANTYTRRQVRGKLLDQLTRLILPWISFNTAVLFGVYMFDMENPRYFYARFERLPVLFAGAEILIYWQLYSIIAMYWVLLFTLFTFVTTFWLKKLTSALDNGKVGSVAKIIRSYKQLQMLNSRHNDCFSSLAWPSFILCAISCHAFCIYLTIMLNNQMSPPAMTLFGSWVIVWLVIQVAVYTVVGKYEGLSLELRRLCILHCDSKLNRRRVLSLRPLRVMVGKYGYIDRSAALVAILLVSNVTVNAILIL